jgi:DNA-binding GntR family transcriptional regulator
MEQILKKLEAAVRGGERKEYVRLNRAFHFGIYAAAGSDVLLAIIEPADQSLFPPPACFRKLSSGKRATSNDAARFERS